ncbi:G-type lectin S-receptor-like serine/threonine-protein kinase At4g03230 isoform X1 [Cannabis sativa]|uniref:G-type lectin S-receptor-like serine/threonine-protein kinase At4g03230 isoform X1 n=2 Tax=Cannabis sativa TaxID=3483 RepID=UPI0029CA89E1|nr:G-type lectin S-receptor-like serine/threonine-protein kinase At4g03230 isoform X1 [Cannabis sativa]
MDIEANRYRPVVPLLGLLLLANFIRGDDTISANQSLSGFSTIVSAGTIFVLGFFKLGKAENYYLGIWYQVDPSRTVVWVANREKPVSFYSELKISDGNLILYDKEVPIWSTDVTSATSPDVQAVLMDSGNLVLTDGSSSSEPLWQSFDHLSHTWLPGSKIGYDKITKTSKLLTSWKSSEDPAPGIYSIELNPRDNSFIISWNRSRSYWTSGSWNGTIFSLIPEMRDFADFKFLFVENENESYITYSFSSSSYTTRYALDVSGQLRQLNWLSSTGWNLFWSQPRQQCEVYAFCGPYGSCNENSLPFCTCLSEFKPTSELDWDLGDYSGGCARVTKLECGNNSLPNGEKDRFLAMPNMLLPENKQSLRVGSDECESRCLKNCSCTAYAYENNDCSIWKGNLLNLEQLSAAGDNIGTLYVRQAASERKKESSKSSKSKILYAVLGTIAAAFLISSIAFSIHRRRRKQTKSKGERMKLQGIQEVRLYDTEKQIANFIKFGKFSEDSREGIDVPYVVLESIVMATNNFSDLNKLGQGGFGPVYKGKFPGGQEIAIKRLSSGSGQGLEEFKNEVMLIAKLQHRNLVRLLGYCVEGEEKLLLYEYMPNKSLDSFIFDRTLSVLLNWELRFDIILGIARGLVYLHHDSRLRIIHRDLKTSNVLLDEEMNPKISDFGLARIFGGKQTEGSTTRVVGTYGYMSPEYALDGFFSIKSDVFSFGVMVLEILSGKKNTGFYQSEEALSLLGYAWKMWKDNKTLDLMDAALSESCNASEFLRCVNVGLLCVQEDPSDRPTMPNVIFMLGNVTASLQSPKQPAFVASRSLPTSASPSKSSISVNEITNTLENGR